MSASATPIPGDTTPNTATRITNVRSLTFVRVLWFALLLLELARMAYLVPVNLTPQGLQADSLAILTELNIVQPILYFNVFISNKYLYR